MSSVLPQFVSSGHDRPWHGDLSSRATERAVALQAVRKIFALDESKFVFSGYVDTKSESEELEIAIRDTSGQPVRIATVETSFSGFLDVTDKEGVDPLKAMGRDVIGAVQKIHLEALGLPPDFPCDSSLTLNLRGALETQVCPAW